MFMEFFAREITIPVYFLMFGFWTAGGLLGWAIVAHRAWEQSQRDIKTILTEFCKLG